MRSQEHHWDLELLEDLNRLLGIVVAGAIQQDHGLLAPVGPELVELLHQSQEVDLHDLGVTVGLGEREVGVPESIDSRDHGDSWAEGQSGYCVGRAMLSPLHPSEVGHAEPGLIDVQEGVSGLPHLEELQGPLLSEDEILRRVGVVGRLDNLSVAHAHLIRHHASDEFEADLYAYFFFDSIAHALC